MNKIMFAMLQLIVACSLVSPVFSMDALDDLGGDWKRPVKSIIEPKRSTDQGIVPQLDGTPQSHKNFELLFLGKEDKTSVRVSTRVSIEHYTLREKVEDYITPNNPPSGYLSGTITSHGILTNGHGFLEEVPCIQNWWFEKIGANGRYYRILEPIKMEQGLTIDPFTAKDENSYFIPKLLPKVPALIHAVYSKEDVESIFLMEGYFIPSRTKRNGWIYGRLNTDKDVALVKIRENKYPEKVCQIAKDFPSEEGSLRKVSIYQYPLGHPLQKKSFGYADFFNKKHYCVTEPGSSGSSLRDFDSEHLMGIHNAGSEGYNCFIPFNVSMIAMMNMEVYPNKHVIKN